MDSSIIVAIIIAATAVAITFIVTKEISNNESLRSMDNQSRDTKESIEASEAIDQIITDALEEYILFNIKITEIDYITEKIENDMMGVVSEKAALRISPTLYDKLSIMYSYEYIYGDLLGMKIYSIVTDFIINFNKPK